MGASPSDTAIHARGAIMNIGIIGAGQIGGVLAKRLVQLGHTVKLANSRGPASLAELATATGAQAVTVRDAVKDVALVVVTIPQKSIAELPRGLFAEVPRDVAVIDTGNYYPALRDGKIDAIEQGLTESGWVARELGRPVVKVFNSISWYSLAERGQPAGAPGRIALPVAADDAGHKAVVMQLVEALGFDAVDAGSIDESWRFQPITPAYCTDWDASKLRQALATADRATALKVRDLATARLASLPPDTKPSDMANIARAFITEFGGK
jgi:8-hydroxy-5-deazaflavin:NADPH oxidoreductase